MTDTEPFLFVSHVSEDRAAALEIVGELERRGVQCWIAPRNIEPGRPFDDEIASALDRCRAMLLIFSERCNESEYIRREVTVAGESQKVIIPFRIEDVQPRRGLRVRLSDLHWLDGFAAHDGAIEELAKRFGPSADGPYRETTPPPVPAFDVRRLWPVAVGLGAPIVVAAGVWLWAADRSPKPGPAPVVTMPADPLAKGKAAFDRKDYGEAIGWLREAAERGDATAQTYIGYLYENGLGTQRDYGEALRWYRKAADQGHAPAQRNLGNLYQQGLGVRQDYAEALRWYRPAAEKGNAGAQTNLGYLFEQGLSVPQDYAAALRWYRKAAEQGEATAQNNIGTFYDKGYGVPQDYAEALRWYRMAAEQGNIDAEYNLALLYADGHGVARDPEQAQHWMQKAADAGDPQAQKWLGSHREAR